MKFEKKELVIKTIRNIVIFAIIIVMMAAIGNFIDSMIVMASAEKQLVEFNVVSPYGFTDEGRVHTAEQLGETVKFFSRVATAIDIVFFVVMAIIVTDETNAVLRYQATKEFYKEMCDELNLTEK